MTTTTENLNLPVIVEFTTRPGVQTVSAKSPADLAAQSAEALESAMHTIQHMAQRVTTAVSNLAERPSEVEVAFGLKFEAEAGAIIAKVGSEASLNVTLKWDLKKAEEKK